MNYIWLNLLMSKKKRTVSKVQSAICISQCQMNRNCVFPCDFSQGLSKFPMPLETAGPCTEFFQHVLSDLSARQQPSAPFHLQAVSPCRCPSPWTRGSDPSAQQRDRGAAPAAFLPCKGKPHNFSHSLGILCAQKTNFELKFVGPDFLCVLNIDFFPKKKCPILNLTVYRKKNTL